MDSPTITIRPVTLPVSPFTNAILDTVRMYYTVPGRPADPNGLDLLRAFGALSGTLAEMAAAIHRADPQDFGTVQPMLVHCCTQLAMIVSSDDPKKTGRLLVDVGLSHDGREFDPRPSPPGRAS